METQKYQPKRGDIIMASGFSFGDRNRLHCGVIVSNETLNTYSSNVIVCWMAKGDRRLDLKTHAVIYSSGTRSTVFGECVQFIPKEDIAYTFASCTEIEMHIIERCIKEALAWD